MANITRTQVDPSEAAIKQIQVSYDAGAATSVTVHVEITTQETGEKEMKSLTFQAADLPLGVRTALANFATNALNRTRQLMNFTA